MTNEDEDAATEKANNFHDTETNLNDKTFSIDEVPGLEDKNETATE